MSIVTLFLLRARLRNQGLVPSTSSSRHTRSGSPLRGGSTLIISAPKWLHISSPNLTHQNSLEHSREIEGKATTHPSSCPVKGPAMSCPSSRTRTPDNGRLLDLSFVNVSEALATATPLPIMWSYSTVALAQLQYSQPAADQGTRRRSPGRTASRWTKSHDHNNDQKKETAFGGWDVLVEKLYYGKVR